MLTSRGTSPLATKRAAVDCGKPIVWVCTEPAGELDAGVTGKSGESTHCCLVVSAGSVSGPGSRFRDCWPVRTPPPALVKIGSSEISACGLPTASQGIQMLYDAPSWVGLKCFLNCSAVNAKRLSGT